MKSLSILVASLIVLALSSLARSEQGITVVKAGSQPSTVGSAERFTGTARIDSRFQASDPGRVRGGVVTFEPGARTAWHKHPLGQTLIITTGVGWVQRWNGSIQTVYPGDIVWIPPNVKHWHGASADARMSHIAIGEALNGTTVEWLELVTEEQYAEKTPLEN